MCDIVMHQAAKKFDLHQQNAIHEIFFLHIVIFTSERPSSARNLFQYIEICEEVMRHELAT